MKDGVLTDPRRCHFNPETLLCKGSDTTACYTAAQVGAVRKLSNGLRSPEGEQLPTTRARRQSRPGGGQLDTGLEPGEGGHANLGVPFFKFMVFDNPDWDYRAFKYDAPAGQDSDIDYMDAKLGGLPTPPTPTFQIPRQRRQDDPLPRL